MDKDEEIAMLKGFIDDLMEETAFRQDAMKRLWALIVSLTNRDRA